MTTAPAAAAASAGSSSSSLSDAVAAARRRLAQVSRRRALFFLKQHVPILEWLPAYDIHEDLPYDLVAGVTVGLMIVPQEISLSTMMGVPPIYGLYTAALVPMVYPLFGTSRVLSVANGAEVSLLVGSAIKKVESVEERVATGILLSFLSGLLLLVMGVLRLGVIADFFSRPVMGGFISAGGVLIMLSQCANWFGVVVKSHDLPLLTVIELFEKATSNMNALSFLLGLISILVLVGMRELKRRVVIQLARLEEMLEDEFALETARALAASSSSTSSSYSNGGNMDDEHDADVETTAKEQKTAVNGKKNASVYDDIELGDANGAGTPKASSSDAPRRSLFGWTNNLPPMLSTGTLKRSDFIMSSPWTTTNSRRRNGNASSTNPRTSTTTGGSDTYDIEARSTRHAARIMDEGIGLSLSDEDYINRERPLDMVGASAETPSRRAIALALAPPTLSRSTSESSVGSTRSTRALLSSHSLRSDDDRKDASRQMPRRRQNSSQDRENDDGGRPKQEEGDELKLKPTKRNDEDEDERASDDDADHQDEQDDADSKETSLNGLYARVRADLASPAKSTTSVSTCTSTTALTGNALERIVSSSIAIRILRSKIAVLIALRLVCELGAFFVCLLGGIVGYLVSDDDGDDSNNALMLTGDVPGGYPSPILPWYGLLNSVIETDRLYHIIIDTLSIALISYMASVAIGKRLAIKEGYRIRPNQELIALGMSNLVGSFFQSMPATGGLSRTAVNMQNARTQLASLITVLVVVLALYTATSALAYLPKTSLSAIIIVAGYSLIEMKEAKWLYRVKRDEFCVWLASFSLTCLLGVLPGLLSSIFCSLIAVIYKTRRPTVTMLGEIPDPEGGASRIVDLDLFPDTARPLSDIVVIRVEGALYFANCEYIERVVEREISKRHETEDVRVLGVAIDAGSIMEWDSTTIQMMKHLRDDLRLRGIQLAIVSARDRLQNLLESSEFLDGIVRQDARIGFNEAIAAIREDALGGDE